MRLWKLLGLAGVAGVAATGAVLARDERQRRAYTPDDVRARLRERAAAASADVDPDLSRALQVTGDQQPARRRLRRFPALTGPLRRLGRPERRPRH